MRRRDAGLSLDPWFCKEHPLNARIDIRNATVTYYLRKTAKGKKVTERGAVGAQINVGRRYLEVEALKNISLTLKHGDRVGLIGINGSGKSTLLKLCAGALSVQSGAVEIEGRISPQFNLGSGLKPDLSGRRNAELKCLYMRIPQSKITDYVEEVRELSGLGGYFELPIRSYSAGMKSRLVMSLLRLVRGDILIMDEWINAADPTINRTVSRLQTELIANASILLMASHSRRVMEDWTETVVWLDCGTIRALGSATKIFDEYKAWMQRQ